MPTYALQTDLEAYLEDSPLTMPAGGVADRLLGRAERDVDTLLVGYGALNATTGLKYDPAVDLEAWQVLALNRATCAQAEYRLRMGEDFFIVAQYDRQQGPDFTIEGELPYIGPQVERELQATGLIRAYGVKSVSTSAVDPYSRYGLLGHVRAN